MIVRPQIQKIDEWYQNGWLTRAINAATYFPLNATKDRAFENIWAPTRVWENDKSTGPTDEWEWHNYGFSSQEIADAYWTQYGWCYFPTFYFDNNEFSEDETNIAGKVIMGIRAQYLKNLLKYKKMIELAGFAYDPLNNVDAHELFSVFENHGGEKQQSASSGQGITGQNLQNQHKVAPYDGDNTATKVESEDITTGQGATDNASASIKDSNNNTIVSAQTGNKANIGASTSTASSGYSQTEHINAKNIGEGGVEEDYTVDGKNNAFGQDLQGADYYKAEKHRRYGNIGVTKTQELLEAEREQLRFNLLQEFFDDINKVILIGVY